MLSTKDARLFGKSLLLNEEEEEEEDNDWGCDKWCGIWFDEEDELSLINCSMLSLKI